MKIIPRMLELTVYQRFRDHFNIKIRNYLLASKVSTFDRAAQKVSDYEKIEKFTLRYYKSSPTSVFEKILFAMSNEQLQYWRM